MREQQQFFLVNPLSNAIVWFNKFYTKDKRIPLHLAMWLLFGILVEFGLLIDYKLSFYTSLFFLGRTLIGNAIVFYLFFYFILPRFILKKKILLGVLLTIGSLFIWRINEYFAMLITSQYANISNTNLLRQVNAEIATGLYWVISPKKFAGGLIFIFYSLSPQFCLKIIVDMINLAYTMKELEKDKASLEVDFLKSQLNPHFLFNTLNSIYILNMKKDEAASDLILELSDTLRYTLYESNTEKVALEKELDFLQNYVNLERVRQNKNTRIDFNCDPSGVEKLTISPLLMFPFLENAFKHGLGTSLKNAWLEINTKVVGRTFHFNIKNSKDEENNGKQIKDQYGGIGVANTKKRLALLYPNNHILEIENTPEYYCIDLKINLKHE